MPRTIGRLTAIRLKNLTRSGYYADGGNLYFRIAVGGTKGWIFRFSLAGRTRDMGLGAFPAVSLSQARKLAEECRQLLAGGRDPIEIRRARRAEAATESAKVMTFEACAKAFIGAHEASWRNPKHRQQWTNTLATYVISVFGKLPVQAIDTGLVMQVLEPLWSKKPETASRVRGRIEAILDWAKVRGYREGENPARWRGHLNHLLPAKSKVRRVRHHPALPYADIPDLMPALREQTSIAARALEFLILTGTRTSETLKTTWDEIDLVRKVWTIPAERMKAGKEQRVPLSSAALDVLETVQNYRMNDFVFPGLKPGQPLSQMALLMLLRRMGYGNITSHGFRSTLRDWAAERTTLPREVAEMALAHAIPSAVEAAYRRGDLFDKRRKLMEAWGSYCRPPRSEKVVPLRREAATR